MRKLLLIFSILFLWSTPCFANDIYTGESSGYSCYLRPESIKGTYKVTPGNPIAITTINYSVILVPSKQELDKLKTLMVDNDITYMVANYRYEEYYDRVANTGKNSFDKLFLIETSLYSSSGEEKYKSNKKDTNKLPESDKQDAVTAYNEMFKYVNEHKEVVESILH